MLKIRANKKLTFPKGLDPEIVWCKCRYFREVNIWINQFPELPAIQTHFKSGSNYRIKPRIFLDEAIKVVNKL